MARSWALDGGGRQTAGVCSFTPGAGDRANERVQDLISQRSARVRFTSAVLKPATIFLSLPCGVLLSISCLLRCTPGFLRRFWLKSSLYFMPVVFVRARTTARTEPARPNTARYEASVRILRPWLLLPSLTRQSGDLRSVCPAKPGSCRHRRPACAQPARFPTSPRELLLPLCSSFRL